VVDPAGRVGDDTEERDERRFRSIETLADLVGRYCWLEHRLFEMTGAWASASRAGIPDAAEAADAAEVADALDVATALDVANALDAERRVWCAAVSRRHGALSMRWRERLPLRAGVDRAALVSAPPGTLPSLLEELAEGTDAWDGLDALVRGVLPGLAETYAAHLRDASVVSEGPVLEVLVEARREGLREIDRGLALLRRLPETEKRAGHGPTSWARDIDGIVEQAFGELGVFPAVHPS
jgi:hypothetical protein